MKIQNLREVKAKLSQIVSELPAEGSVVISKTGRPYAVLISVTEDTDLEIVALSQNRALWKLYDEAASRATLGRTTWLLSVAAELGR